ncbi:MAG TPA: beta galactosidase jelly roll domain-containing protein [Bacteroidota bacterium]|nr:beta galactosidase jelly roll domain-containing protein [Bacteroidota bacterium]
MPATTLQTEQKEIQTDIASSSALLNVEQKSGRRQILAGLILFASLFAFHEVTVAQEWKMLVDFRGQWKFKLGDKPAWADPKLDDSKWDQIFVPANWEDEGYPGYDGYAWYRKHFRISSDLKDKPLYIHIGDVDDVSEVYLNGHFVSFTGAFPPHFVTAYNIDQKFEALKEYLTFNGDNVIAVRVYDDQLVGGMVSGKPGVFEMEDYFYPDVAIAGDWRLKTGDDDDWAKPSFDDSEWKHVLVPAYWETQGFKDYDGVGWYRIHFTVPDKFSGQDLVLLLGKIDDVDKAYLNGEYIGRTGGSHVHGDEYRKFRAYTVSSDIIKFGGTNVLAVRVYDNFLGGGIYDGPIGFVTGDHYRRWERAHTVKEKDRWKFFDIFK